MIYQKNTNDVFRLHSFDDNLSHALYFADKKTNEPKFLKNFLYRIYRYVKSLQAANPNLTKQEILDTFSKDIEEFSEISYCGAKIPQNYMNYICYEVFANNPGKLDRNLESVNSFYTNSNYTFEDMKKMPKSTFSLTQLYYAAKLQHEFEASDSQTDILTFLDTRRKELESILRSDICKSTLAILNGLDKLKLLDSYLEINEKKMDYLGFSEFAKPLSSGDPNKKSEKLLEIFSDSNIMNKYSPSELLTLYSFWVNRYYKELDTYLEGMFVVHDLDLVPQMLDGTFKSPSKDDLKKCIVKMNLFYDPNRFYLEMQKSDRLSDSNESELDISNNIYDISDELFLHYVQKEYGTKYKEFFDGYLPQSQNNLVQDAKKYFELYRPIFATYNLKDTTMIYLLLDMIENSKYSNAGLIPTSRYAGNIRFDKFIGIGIDSGMSDTFLLHINKNTLTDFLSGYLSKTKWILPLYSGKTDFTDGKYSIPVLTPLVDEQKDLLNMKSLDASGKNKTMSYIRHLQNIQNGNSNNGSITYVDLASGNVIREDAVRDSQEYSHDIK